MRFLVDTHVLLWQAEDSNRMTEPTRRILQNSKNDLVFSVVSLWEIVIKNAKSRGEFSVDPIALRIGLTEFGYSELPIRAEHLLEVAALEPLHNDPFDRLLLAQARVEGLTLLTADRAALAYGFPVLKA
ncbi:MAG: type II toxin-antitoxin system VapC family toxin [Lacisediminihabitans sp.]